MRELSIFADESGDKTKKTRYFLLTLVFHDQADSIAEQVAVYLCTIELATVKYVAKENGGTYDKFFGGIGSFKQNWLKQACRKHVE